jgi:hypothetical protein
MYIDGPPKDPDKGRNNPLSNSNKNIIIDIFGMIVNHVVTIVEESSYTSGAQL